MRKFRNGTLGDTPGCTGRFSIQRYDTETIIQPNPTISIHINSHSCIIQDYPKTSQDYPIGFTLSQMVSSSRFLFCTPPPRPGGAAARPSFARTCWNATSKPNAPPPNRPPGSFTSPVFARSAWWDTTHFVRENSV